MGWQLGALKLAPAWALQGFRPSRARGLLLQSRVASSKQLHKVGGRRPFSAAASAHGFQRLLDPIQRDILASERALLVDLHSQLLELGTPQEELSILRDAIGQMEELFMVCVVGEFNAGKSSFINALLGDKWLKEGVLPTTEKVCVLKHGPEVARTSQIDAFGHTHEDVEELRLPVPWLQDLAIVDTPGTNAIVLAHESLTKRIVPRADLVLFVTSSDRPFSESERVFLELIGRWGKKVVFVVNKIDILPDDASVAEVCAFVAKNGAKQLRASLGAHSSGLGAADSYLDTGATGKASQGGGEQALAGWSGVPLVLPVSAKLALRAKLSAPSVKRQSDNDAPGGAAAPAVPAAAPLSSSLSAALSAAEQALSAAGGGSSGGARGGHRAGSAPLSVQVVERHDPSLGAGAAHWERSRFGALEATLRKALTAEERVVAKLLSPLGVAERLLEAAAHRVADRSATLEADLATVALVDGTMASFRRDMARDVAFERLQIGKALSAMQARGDAFFDTQLSVGNAHALLTARPGSMRKSFEAVVVGGVEEAVAESLGEMATLIEDRSRSQARAVLDFLGRRPQQVAAQQAQMQQAQEKHQAEGAFYGGGGVSGKASSVGGGGATSMLVGQLHDGHFDGVRYRILAKLTEQVNHALGGQAMGGQPGGEQKGGAQKGGAGGVKGEEGAAPPPPSFSTPAHHRFDPAGVAARVGDAARLSVSAVAGLEASAGALAALAGLAVVDPTGGALAACGLAAAGGAVLPWRRWEQKRAFRAASEKLAKSLDEELEQRLGREVHRVAERIVDAVSPWSRFVAAEDQRAKAAAVAVANTQAQIKALKQRVLLRK